MQRKLQKTRVLQRDIKAVASIFSLFIYEIYVYTNYARVYSKNNDD